ncbi:UDP-N-acetylmuramate--L-alanine ligase [Tenacibaculum sp. SZ-18]|uniref:UDP-N-acetylmuramate--L-alanine ligase n=1 Tax=Tenacibaculum sp. SZ-18 TaxID=754423 RepID=UPI000C2D1E44|nr:UDP-N-acetylmuramate--L-alanine ligase [Tenacibaculum sp. SZ-18]AUC14058.1 UDP-N-acetylmuramate--L-alanine ligase [Tenacibaculum sp. SZ-18]
MDLKNIHNVYFIGIGGIGMSALARYFFKNYKKVAGYDKTPSPLTKELENLGIEIHYDDNLSLVSQNFLNKENSIVVYTPAIPNSHKELSYFLQNDFHVLKRAEVLGKITENTFCLAVAGTHGKTTTSSILGHIMQPFNATSFLGGITENYNSNLILGKDEVSVVEADEYDRSFLQLSPNIACVTSMDADHLDIYGEHNSLLESFKEFSNKVTEKLIVAKGLELEGLTYAIDEDADYKAFNLRVGNGAYLFDVATPQGIITDIEFSLPGRHNIMNALAALGMANCYGVSLEDIKSQLKTFAGVQRRFSYKIKEDNLVLIDDYAHHPTEIKVVASAVREMYPDKKVLAVFQPHLYSRTKDFIEEFAYELSKFDDLVLLDIYPARELPMEGVTSKWLLSKIKSENKCLLSKEKMKNYVKESDASVVLMLGAGDIGLLVKEVKEVMINRVKKV